MTTKREPHTIQIIDDRWYRIAHGEPPHYLECCDCSLVHRVRYKVENGVIWEQWTRDDRLTAKVRKKEPK